MWEGIDGGGEVVVYYADIALCGGDVGVAEEFLDGT